MQQKLIDVAVILLIAVIVWGVAVWLETVFGMRGRPLAQLIIAIGFAGVALMIRKTFLSKRENNE